MRRARSQGRRSENFAAIALFQTVERLVHEVPHVAEALYGDQAAHLQALSALAASKGEPAAIAEALERWDRLSVERFRSLLGASDQALEAGP